MRLPEISNHEHHDGDQIESMGENLLQGEGARSGGSRVALFVDRFGSLMLLFVVIGVSAALLYGMRKLGTAGKLDLVNIKIDYPMDSLNRTKGEDHRKIIDELLHGHMVEQVPLERIQMNPFHWQWISPTASRDTGMSEEERLAMEERRAAEEKRRSLDAAYRRMALNSVIGGRNPAAYISGERYMVGDLVEEYFVVERIEGRSVTLVHEGEIFVLTVGG